MVQNRAKIEAEDRPHKLQKLRQLAPNLAAAVERGETPINKAWAELKQRLAAPSRL
jgi:hypothetical protein